MNTLPDMFERPIPEIIETERLKLRALKKCDAKKIFELYSCDPEATRYMSFKCTGRLEDTESFVDGSVAYFTGQPSQLQQLVWVFELKENGQMIGSGGVGSRNSFCVSGGYILSKQFWGKGYASEAWKRIVDWVKTNTRIYRIEAWHDLDNPASGKVLLKGGLEYEGISRRYAIFPNVSDEPRDAKIYAWAR